MGVADTREVLVVDIADRPGTLGEVARRFADANVNVELAYTTFGGVKLVVATDDLDRHGRLLLSSAIGVSWPQLIVEVTALRRPPDEEAPHAPDRNVQFGAASIGQCLEVRA